MEVVIENNKKEKVKYFFVILLYRNTNDIIPCIKSIKEFITDSRILLVNSYYDDASLNDIKNIAQREKCEFLNVPNKGYGYGNNRGIEYANQHFQYEFLIISNPDIVIKQFKELNLRENEKAVIGPVIKTKKSKMQNPYLPFNNYFTEKIIYEGFKTKKKQKVFIGFATNRLVRELYLFWFKITRKRQSKVFAVHGSFLIFSRNVLEEIGLPYDEEMFLFAEESHLAHLLKEKGINSYIVKDIEILHKEDGSISMSNININGEAARSTIIYYEKIKHKFK